MKTFVMAALLATTSASGVAVAQQPAQPTLDHPSATNTLSEQLKEVSARIDHRQADGRLSKLDADNARLEVNDIDSDISDRRLQGGGVLAERDRFVMQERIRQLIVKIDSESAAAPPPRG